MGTTTITATTSSLSNDGTATETPNKGNCNYNSCSPNGLFRAGCYYDMGDTREAKGATYYGILDMSGSLRERPVTIFNRFTGMHGNGTLSTSGNATNPDWPGYKSLGEVTGAIGSGIRGGSWYEAATSVRVSDRSIAAYPLVLPGASVMAFGRCVAFPVPCPGDLVFGSRGSGRSPGFRDCNEYPIKFHNPENPFFSRSEKTFVLLFRSMSFVLISQTLIYLLLTNQSNKNTPFFFWLSVF